MCGWCRGGEGAMDILGDAGGVWNSMGWNGLNNVLVGAAVI